MDIEFDFGRERFKYRVCAVIINEGSILAMHDERSPYYYLPGGKVRMGETAEEAVVREVREELEIEPKLVRPLWFTQSFFREDVDGLDYHELCIYYLLDVSDTGLADRGPCFTLTEGRHTHDFEWLEFERLRDEYFYPLFLKTEIFSLPEELTIKTIYE